MHERNCFITLTYSPENLPPDLSLDVSHFQIFMKWLRMQTGCKVRFFHCGEYGEKEHRPHYHACLFGYDFEDRKLWTMRNGIPLYQSAELSSIWSLGYSSVGTVTFQSAAYVARYITKKITGPEAEAHYNGRRPEYTTMSRRPGIGSTWFQKYQADCYPSDTVYLNGKLMKPPKYYDGLYELQDPSSMALTRGKRKHLERHPLLPSPDGCSRRLKDRETCKEAQASRLVRDLE